jgi:magnesium transporter
MTNTLYLPELREMLAEQNAAELREFCSALHPAQTAEFMEGLTSAEAWQVLWYAEPAKRVEIFGYFEPEKQIAVIENEDRVEVAELLRGMPNDECVDLLNRCDPAVAEELLKQLPKDERRDILRLREYPEGTAGAVMTTEFAHLPETDTVREALEHLAKQSEALETIYYVYVLDGEDHLRGIVSARQLVSAIGKPNVKIGDLMERAVVSVDADEDQEAVAAKIADFDLLAIPVVDAEHHMLGIITHDDALDVVREEMAEDAHRLGGIEPLAQGYLETRLTRLFWNRGIWVTIFFFVSILTAIVLNSYAGALSGAEWVAIFIPLIISSGGISGNQSATLVITALATGDITLSDWWYVVRREIYMGILLGGFVATLGLAIALLMTPSFASALVVAITLFLVVNCGTLAGSVLPLVFRRLGLDPALMSNPFVAGLIDILGILIYMQVAIALIEI